MIWNDPKHRGPITRGPYIAYNGGPRNPAAIRVVVVHDAEGANAKNVASWGAGGQRNASWHYVVDNTHLIQQVADETIAWAAPGANGDGLQLEICGFARWSRLEWFRHQATLKRAAWQVARWCVKHNIPARWLTDKQLRDKVSEGLTTHAQCSRVFGGSDHSDPGPNFPRGYFLWLVKRRVGWIRSENA